MIVTLLPIFFLCSAAYPSPSTHTNLNPPPGEWGAPYTAQCPHKFGPLSHARPDLYSMTWTIVFSNGNNVVIDSNSSTI